MAGERTLPGLGLTAFYDLGSDGWKPGVDGNFLKLSTVVQGSAISRTTELPAAPTDGDIYIVPSDAAANANEIAVRDNGAWVYLPASSGWTIFVADVGGFVFFNGTAWAILSGVSVVGKTADYTLAVTDADTYIRMDVATANTVTVPENATAPFPIGATISVRQVGAGKTTIVGAGAVVVNTSETLSARKTGSTLGLIKVGADEWDLTGDIEAL